MKVFIVGATGYIGSHAARRLQAAGHAVVGFARSAAGAQVLREAGLQAHVGDVADLADLRAAVQRADATIFAPQLTAEEEYVTVAALLDASAGRRFIFTSGTGVLGQRTAGAWSEDSFAEDDAFTPSRSIARRVETENLVRASVAQGVHGIVLRPPMIWGHRRYVAVDLIAESIRRTGAACYVGDGLNLYSNVHVDDLADLFGLALEKGQAGALYHSVSGELNFRHVAELLARRLGVPTRSVSMDEAIEIWGKFPTLIVLSVCSRSRSPRARRELGWTPTRLGLPDAILNDDFLALA